VRAAPRWEGAAEFAYQGTTVRVVPCVSALAVREALHQRSDDSWLVLLTDAAEENLGLSIRARLSNHQFVSPDSWQAVQELFKATKAEYQLLTQPSQQAVATGILSVSTSGVPWPPAPAGLLTTAHAFGSIARQFLEIDPKAEGIDHNAVLRWSVQPTAAGSLADLRARAGDALTEAILRWLADQSARLSEMVQRLLTSGRVSDLLPLGLVARVIATPGAGAGPRVLLKKEVGTALDVDVLSAWADAAENVIGTLVNDAHPAVGSVLARAEQLLDELEAKDLAAESPVLRTGLEHRCGAVADALSRAVTQAGDVDPTVLTEAEGALRRVDEHVLARRSGAKTADRVRAAVRLLRWLAAPPAAEPTTVPTDTVEYVTRGAWVDRAISTAWSGGDDNTAKGLRAAVDSAFARRAAERRRFAHHLQQLGDKSWPMLTGTTYVEDLLDTVVQPLLGGQRVLLIVADGMSVPVASAIADDLSAGYDSWQECLPVEREERMAALAVLPSLTEYSRTSLLTGSLRRGTQHDEKKEFPTWCTDRGYKGIVFHKKDLDESPSGFAFSGDVTNALKDPGTHVVACVLNTIDDALDKSDPGGMEWGADSVKHLRPLLDQARATGRIVVLTSDHGHVVERRAGGTVDGASGTATSNRSRTDAFGPGAPEVLISGRRVLPEGKAVLLVDEDLRYQTIKAGYHGGASPAEVVIPVTVFTPSAPPQGWQYAPPQAPAWWRDPLTLEAPVVPAGLAPTPAPRKKPAPVADDQDALFAAEPVPVPEVPVAGVDGTSLVLVLQKSKVYKEQQKRLTRRGIGDDRIAQLLSALLAKPARRISADTAAAALGVATTQLPGALPLVQRVLNVEQYPVISRDAGTAEVVLDEDLLREQFGLL